MASQKKKQGETEKKSKIGEVLAHPQAALAHARELLARVGDTPHLFFVVTMGAKSEASTKDTKNRTNILIIVACGASPPFHKTFAITSLL